MKRFIFIHLFVYFHILTLSISTVKWSEVIQSCLTLCYPTDYSPPGSSVHGIFHARILEWVAISFSRGSSWLRDQTQVSCTAGLFTVWATVAAAAAKSLQSCPTLCDPIDDSHQASPSLAFSRQEHWSGLPVLSPKHESEKWKWSRSVMSNS